jgi:hypothetical protein
MVRCAFDDPLRTGALTLVVGLAWWAYDLQRRGQNLASSPEGQLWQWTLVALTRALRAVPHWRSGIRHNATVNPNPSLPPPKLPLPRRHWHAAKTASKEDDGEDSDNFRLEAEDNVDLPETAADKEPSRRALPPRVAAKKGRRALSTAKSASVGTAAPSLTKPASVLRDSPLPSPLFTPPPPDPASTSVHSSPSVPTHPKKILPLFLPLRTTTPASCTSDDAPEVTVDDHFQDVPQASASMIVRNVSASQPVPTRITRSTSNATVPANASKAPAPSSRNSCSAAREAAVATTSSSVIATDPASEASLSRVTRSTRRFEAPSASQPVLTCGSHLSSVTNVRALSQPGASTSAISTRPKARMVRQAQPVIDDSVINEPEDAGIDLDTGMAMKRFERKGVQKVGFPKGSKRKRGNSGSVKGSSKRSGSSGSSSADPAT